MRLRASEIATEVEGALVGPDVEVEGAGIDSRQLVPGQLFVPVVAARDGHDHIADALAAGAAAYLTARAPQGGTAVVVDDPTVALSRLGAAARDRLPDRVVGVTGSVGKTTTKDLAAAALGAGLRTHANLRSFNNELGVPLTLLGAPQGTEAVVVEMGARGVGHIAHLCSLARPTVGVVTTVEAVHTELFGDLEGVARAKGELVEALPASGTAVLNAQRPAVLAMGARTSARVLTFGVGEGDVRADGVVLDDQLRPRFSLASPWGRASVQLGLRGAHNVGNALAALAAALSCGVGLEAAVAAVAEAEGSPWRMDLRRAPSGALVLNDAYNAGPASMAAALRSLAELDVDRRVAVLGVMAELGPDGADAHAEAAALAATLGIEVVAVATPDYGVAPVGGIDEARTALGSLGPGDAVLVKGSRVAGLERLAALLLDEP